MNRITYDILCECNSAICDIFNEEFQVINENNLLSALSVQDSYYDTDEEIISALFRSLIIAHGFKDCNKRTAALVAIFFCKPTCSDEELEKLAIEVTANSRIDVQYIKNKLYGEKEDMIINEDIYNDRGYEDRDDYLRDLANEYGVDYDVVIEVAESIGQEEDFDELPMILDDMLNYKLNHADDDIHDFEYSVKSFYNNYYDGLASDFNTDSIEDAQNEAWNKVQSGLYVVLQGDDQIIYYNPEKFTEDTAILDDVEDTSFDESLNEEAEEDLTDWGIVYNQVPDDVKKFMDYIQFNSNITLLNDGTIIFDDGDNTDYMTLDDFIDFARYSIEQIDDLGGMVEELKPGDNGIGIDTDPDGGFLDESIQLQEMSMERQDAIETCLSLGRQFIEHFKKVIQSNSDANLQHWINAEMQTWLNQVKDITLKSNKKPLSVSQLIDWFFTAGSSVEVLFKDDELLQDLYNDFLSKIVSNNNVEQTLIDMNIIKRDENTLHKVNESLNEDLITMIKEEHTEVVYEVQNDEPVVIAEVEPEICLEDMNEDDYIMFDDSEIELMNIGEEESMNNDNLPCDFRCDNVNKLGTSEYDANTARQNRIAQYRKLAHLADDEEIIEEDLDDWAIKRIACYENKPSARIKAEILGQKWSDYEI